MSRLPRALAAVAVVILVLSSGAHSLLDWDPFLLTFFVPGTLLSIAAALMRRPALVVMEARG